MQIGIGLPATHTEASGKLILDWARLADEGPFSSLGRQYDTTIRNPVNRCLRRVEKDTYKDLPRRDKSL